MGRIIQLGGVIALVVTAAFLHDDIFAVINSSAGEVRNDNLTDLMTVIALGGFGVILVIFGSRMHQKETEHNLESLAKKIRDKDNS